MNELKIIIEAQDHLFCTYGEDGHKSLVAKMLEKTNSDAVTLATIATDTKMDADIRMVALAALGELNRIGE